MSSWLNRVTKLENLEDLVIILLLPPDLTSLCERALLMERFPRKISILPTVLPPLMSIDNVDEVRMFVTKLVSDEKQVILVVSPSLSLITPMFQKCMVLSFSKSSSVEWMLSEVSHVCCSGPPPVAQ